MIATIEVHNGVRVVAVDDRGVKLDLCEVCHFGDLDTVCRTIPCTRLERPDKRDVFFVRLEEAPNE